jgi:hypothetical protein
MNLDDKKITEIFLALILIILLIIMSVSVLNMSSPKKPSQTITISHSFNTINYASPEMKKETIIYDKFYYPESEKSIKFPGAPPTEVKKEPIIKHDKYFSSEMKVEDAKKHPRAPVCKEVSTPLKFSAKSEHKRVTAVFGNIVDRYYVTVFNHAKKGGYFTVKFYFSDYYGEKRVYSMTKFIGPGERRDFLHQTVHHDHKIARWHYEVISESKETFYC